MSRPRVLVLHNEPVLPADHPDVESEREILETVAIVSRVLSEEGFRVRTLGVAKELSTLLDGLKSLRPEVVFNLFEGLADRPFTESVVAGILEWLDIPLLAHRPIRSARRATSNAPSIIFSAPACQR